MTIYALPRGSRVLVTGGAGFIGSHLVERLVADAAQVCVVDNFATGYMENLAAVRDQIQVMIGDIGDMLRLRRIALEQYDVIFHLAANPYIPPSVENPAFDYHENLENPFALLEALRHSNPAPRLINISSAAVYGNPATLPIREFGSHRTDFALWCEQAGKRALHGCLQPALWIVDLLCPLFLSVWASPAQAGRF